MKRTKIVSTIGPTSDKEEILRSLFLEGVDVCRLNFSHGSHQEHQVRIDRIKKIRNELKLPIAIMLDTKGPEIRLGYFKDNMEIDLKSGDDFILTTRDIEGDKTIISLSYKNLPQEIEVGSRILIDDGLVGLKVKKIEDTEIYCLVENGGKLSSRKGVNTPGIYLKLPSLTQKDKEDIVFGVKNDIDFIAASFVNSKDDIVDIRKVLEDAGNFDIRIIAKIESQEGLKNIDKILEVADGIMIARGDLGVEIPTEEVPLAQKEIIKKCNLKGKTVITATQMLDSMMRNPRPTRAEANDVANAVIDGTSAVMLSGETASGKYPLESVVTMRKILEVTEKSINYRQVLRKKIEEIEDTTTNAIGKSTCTMAQDLGAQAIITATTSGYTSRAISKFRPNTKIIAATTKEKVRRQLSLAWGVSSVLVPKLEDTDSVISGSIEKCMEERLLKGGDTVIVTAGVPVGLAGSTNLIKVETISKILVKGQGLGQEKVTSRAIIVKNEKDLIKNFKDGQIIVTKAVTEEMIKYLKMSSGLIVEERGYTSNSAIIAISLGLPAIVGAQGASDFITDGEIISLDAKDGTVRRGLFK